MCLFVCVTGFHAIVWRVCARGGGQLPKPSDALAALHFFPWGAWVRMKEAVTHCFCFGKPNSCRDGYCTSNSSLSYPPNTSDSLARATTVAAHNCA